MAETSELTVRHPATGKTMLSLAGAVQVALAFRELGGFTSVEARMAGFDSGAYEVELWAVNARAGNRNLTVVAHVPASAKEYALIRKAALGKATERDRAALARQKAEREVNRE